MRKSQLESAYKRQQQEISDLKDFVQRNKASVATRNMAMSRQKKLDKMDVIELAKKNRSRSSTSKKGVRPVSLFLKLRIWLSATMNRYPVR